MDLRAPLMTPKPLSQIGVFAFRSPAQPVFQVGRNLLLLFCVPEAKLCSGLLTHPDSSPAELKEMLDNAFRHLLEHLGDHKKPVQVKLFGASYGEETQLRTIYQWLEQYGLKLAAKDLGRNFPRQVRVEIDTGRAGVSYGRAATAGLPEILSLGSAANRLAPTDSPLNVLILSSSPVERRLASQAVEEYAGWKVEAPKDSAHWLAEHATKGLPYALVLVCAGAAREIELEHFFTHHKSTAFAWVGPTFPDFLKHCPGTLYLGPLDPEFLGEFKGGLAELLRSLQGVDTPKPVAEKTKRHDSK